MKERFLIVVFSITTSMVFGQQPWDLQKCINYALENNISIKQSELNVQSAMINSLQGKMNALPNLNGIATHGYNWGQTVDPFTNQFATERVRSNSFSLSSSITLFNGLQNTNTILKNKFDLLSSQYDVEKMKNDISMNVALAYLQVLFSQELLKSNIEQHDFTELQVERTRKQVKVGQLPEGNLLEIEAQLSTEALNVVTAENALTMNKLTLIQLLELNDSPENFEIVVPDFSNLDSMLITILPSEIYAVAVNNLPEIQSAQNQLLSSEKSLAIANGARSPRLSLNGSVGTGYSGASKTIDGNPILTLDTVGYTANTLESVVFPGLDYNYVTKPFNDQLKDNVNQSMSITMSIPIFNNWNVSNNVSRAKINIAQSELNLEQQKNILLKNIQQAYTDAIAALKKEKAARKSVIALEKSMVYTQAKWETQSIDIVSFNDAKTKLNKAKSDLIQAKYDYIFRTMILEFYQGKSLSF